MKALLLLSLFVATTLAQANDIIISGKVSNSFRKLIEGDMDVLDNLEFKEADPKTLEILGLKSLDKNSAKKWLNSRIKYITADTKLKYFVELANIEYPTSKIYPYSLTQAGFSPSSNQEIESYLAMANSGSEVYWQGKYLSKLFGVEISNGLLKKATYISVNSPRVGIVKIGPALFDPDYSPNKETPDAIANSIFRLEVYFHEARHSDGNGASLGFFHSKCPVGHNLEGQMACDDNVNGPYAIGALMTMEMLRACGDNCNEKEKELLKISALDNAGRITSTKSWDPTPEILK